MASQTTTKRPAPDAALDQQQSRTLPPAQRQPQALDLTMRMVPSIYPGVPTALTGQMTETDQRLLEESVLHTFGPRLARRPPEEWLGIIMHLATEDPRARMKIHSVLCGAEMREAEAARTAEERRRKAEEKKMRTPLNFEKLLDRVENYMFKETPWNWTRSREISEAARVSNGIEKIFTDMLSRCGPQTPSDIKFQTLKTMIEMFGIIIDSPGSYTRRESVNNTYFKKKSLDQLWDRLSLEEQFKMAIDRSFLNGLGGISQKWVDHGVTDLFEEIFAGISNAVRQSRGEPWWEDSDGEEAVSSTETTT